MVYGSTSLKQNHNLKHKHSELYQDSAVRIGSKFKTGEYQLLDRHLALKSNAKNNSSYYVRNFAENLT